MKVADYRSAVTGGLAPIRKMIPTATEFLTAFWTDYAGGGATGPWKSKRRGQPWQKTVQFNSPRGQRTYVSPWRGR